MRYSIELMFRNKSCKTTKVLLTNVLLGLHATFIKPPWSRIEKKIEYNRTEQSRAE